MNIRAIPTEYNGQEFRSRLEAKWARCYDLLRIPYVYELNGFELSGIRYLPDFWMSRLNAWIEIKPVEPQADEYEKARRLAEASGSPVYIFYGPPRIPKPNELSAWKIDSTTYTTRHWWTECAVCHSIAPAMRGCVTYLTCMGCDEVTDHRGELIQGHKSGRLALAYREACNTKFEFLPRNLREKLELAS